MNTFSLGIDPGHSPHKRNWQLRVIEEKYRDKCQQGVGGVKRDSCLKYRFMNDLDGTLGDRPYSDEIARRDLISRARLKRANFCPPPLNFGR
jgi:hypothetical protein